MAVTMRSALLQLQSFLDASGYFRTTSIGEPTDPPDGVHGAVMLSAYSHPVTTLSNTVERRDVTVRIYMDALTEPRSEIEFVLDETVANIQAAMVADFDVGSTVRNIDVTSMNTRFGYQTIGNRMYRLADILVPMIIDDSGAFAA
jgi:hypothetical protein